MPALFRGIDTRILGGNVSMVTVIFAVCVVIAWFILSRLVWGRYLYAIGNNGTLTYLGEEATRGNYPRSFNFDPTGQFLYVCNQRADNLTVFRVDRQSGRLSFTGHYTPVGNPSIIVFLDLAAAR